VAAPGRGDLPGLTILPCLRTRKGPGADDPRLALLVRRGTRAGRKSWTALLDAVRRSPGDEVTTVTATQLREVIERLQQTGQHKPGDVDILIVFDAGRFLRRH
jgi:hypothetical protein